MNFTVSELHWDPHLKQQEPSSSLVSIAFSSHSWLIIQFTKILSLEFCNPLFFLNWVCLVFTEKLLLSKSQTWTIPLRHIVEQLRVMASMGSLPFVIDKSFSILVCNRNYSLPFLSFSAKKSICLGGCNGFLKCSKIKATGKEFGEVGEDSDAIQAAINKSQKLLAVQKDLIQQVVIVISI